MGRLPKHNWAIEERAKQVGMSRSVLAERFTELVGIPPIHYLAKWRMQIAAGLLSAGGANLESIAAEIGYASEAAFSRAFKKMAGMPPSAWRGQRAASRGNGEAGTQSEKDLPVEPGLDPRITDRRGAARRSADSIR